jgi:Rrf2 family transcriptional regulator, iron-sulfur cluster assembly transcription factor
MRISTAGRYALRAMLDLALYGQAGPILRHEIAQRQDISGEYIAQLFRQLTRAGLAQSVMGPGGGYQLALPPEQISAGAILQAVEGPFAAVFCVLPHDPHALADSQPPCARVETCAAHVLWSRLTRVIADYLNSVSLRDLCDVAHQFELSPGACQEPISAFLQPFPAEAECPLEYVI